MDLTDRPRRCDAGFTLVEAMIAGTIGVLVMLPAYALLRNTYATAFVVNSRFQRNAEARQMLTMIGEGSSGSAGGTFVHGIRGQGTIPTNWAISLGGQLVIADLTTMATISGDKTPSITITCTAPATPVPACVAAGMTLSTIGWLGAAPVVMSPTSGRTATVGITVADPYQAARAGQTGSSAVDTYRSQFNLNVQ